ncbi:MAG: phosphoenolpyruvate carboxykinase (GTP), partial [Proteobacteria bacterium]|nr:phosphoenolpyruvate carboxykinase (GTP) [Pseudomonadota bacterium]
PAHETPIGYLPSPADLDTRSLDLPAGAMQELLAVNRDLWVEEMKSVGGYLRQFGARLPKALQEEHAAAVARLS